MSDFNHIHQPSAWESMTQEQKSEKVLDLMLGPALTVMVFLRTDIGFRLLNPDRITRVFFFLLVVAVAVVPLVGSEVDKAALLTFDFLFFAMALGQRRRGWRDFNAGKRRHSYSPGISRIETRCRFPKWFSSHHRVARHIEPLYCLIVALFAVMVSPVLGAWLCLSSVCLMSLEEARYRGALDRKQDAGDSLIEGEIMRENVSHYSEGKQNGTGPKSKVGLPAGIGSDIKQQIFHKKASK